MIAMLWITFIGTESCRSKPENIAIDAEDRIKLTWDCGKAGPTAHLRQIRNRGTLITSPEQVERANVGTGARDIYSLGIILHEMSPGLLRDRTRLHHERPPGE